MATFTTDLLYFREIFGNITLIFTTTPHILQKVKHKDKERKRKFWVHLRCNAS